MNTNALLLTFTIAITFCVGCESSNVETISGDDRSVAQQPTGEPSTTSADAEASEPAVELQLASWDQIQEQIAASDKPTIVDIWSTACLPCMQEFHGLVELDADLGQQVRCISVCIDYIGLKSKPPESYRDASLEFLKSQKATITNYLCADADRDVYKKLELESIPAVFVFAADGSIVRRFVDSGDDAGFTYAKDIRPFVDQMLAGETK